MEEAEEGSCGAKAVQRAIQHVLGRSAGLWRVEGGESRDSDSLTSLRWSESVRKAIPGKEQFCFWTLSKWGVVKGRGGGIIPIDNLKVGFVLNNKDWFFPMMALCVSRGTLRENLGYIFLEHEVPCFSHIWFG